MSRQSNPQGEDDDSPNVEAETRKVQLVGGSTYSVSLLRDWADKQGIQAGTEVYLHPHMDGSLVIRAGPESIDEETEISVTTDELSAANLTQTIHAKYVAGYDTITLVASDGFDTEIRRRIEDTVTGLIGAEVVKEEETRIVIRSLLDPDDVSIRQSLLQLKYMTLEMHEDATAALFEGSIDPTRVIDRDDEVDRLFALVARYFQRGLADFSVIDRLGVDRSILFEYYTAGRQLERIADHAEKIATIAADTDEPIDTELADRAEQARGIVADAMTALLDGSTDSAYQALDTRDSVLSKLETLDRSYYESDADDYRLSLVVDSLIRTAEYGGNIAETAIQATPKGKQQ